MIEATYFAVHQSDPTTRMLTNLNLLFSDEKQSFQEHWALRLGNALLDD